MEDVENTRMPEEMELSGKSYYLDVSLEEAENNISCLLKRCGPERDRHGALSQSDPG